MDKAKELVYKVQAAWLKNFADFTDWPEGAFASASAPFVIGILGDDAFAVVAQRLFQAEKIKGRAVETRKCGGAADAAKCQLVFIGAAEKNNLGQILNQLKSASVLTVGEAARRERSYLGNPFPSGKPASARSFRACSGLYGCASFSRAGWAQWKPGGSIP